MSKTKVTLMIDDATWRLFRAWAIGARSNASVELEKLMRAKLDSIAGQSTETLLKEDH